MHSSFIFICIQSFMNKLWVELISIKFFWCQKWSKFFLVMVIKCQKTHFGFEGDLNSKYFFLPSTYSKNLGSIQIWNFLHTSNTEWYHTKKAPPLLTKDIQKSPNTTWHCRHYKWQCWEKCSLLKSCFLRRWLQYILRIIVNNGVKIAPH